MIVTLHLILTDSLMLVLRFMSYKEMRMKHKNNNPPLADAINLRIVLILLAVLVSILSILQLLEVDMCKYRSVFYIIHLAALVFLVFALLVFTQMLGDFAHILLIVERVTGNVIVYLILCFFVILFFSVGFSITHADCHFTNETRSKTSDMPNFAVSLYYTFLYTMKITTPNDIFFSSSQSPTASIIIFIAGIVIVHLVIVNLLIAVMNRHVNGWYDHLDLALLLIRLSLTGSIEKFRYLNMKYFPGKKISNILSRDYNENYLKTIDDELFLEVVKDITTD